ncbi:MAG: hypothetical protein Q7U20_08420 [Caulobacter sp.]|nr:hypothetical protein [Caulobacter sp.]
MRSRTLFSLIAAAILSVATPSMAADKPLTRDSLLTVLKTGQVWCSGWRDADQSCEDIAFIDLLPDDKVRQVSRYRMSAEPNLEMVVRETVSLEGRGLCSVFRFDELEILVLVDDEPAPIEQAASILAVLAQSMAHLEGKKSCETYVRDEVTGELKAQVTLDGEAAPEFDSIYRLLKPDTRILLRPIFQDSEDATAV